MTRTSSDRFYFRNNAPLSTVRLQPFDNDI